MMAGVFVRRDDIPTADQLHRENADGASMNELAHRYGCDKSTISRRLTEAGLIPRYAHPGPNRRLLPSDDELLALSKQGNTDEAIAARFNAKTSSVQRAMSRARKAVRAADDIVPTLPPAPSEDHDWRSRAACRNQDPDAMFPTTTAGEDEAQAVCRYCPVRNTCAEYALNNRIEYGVFGGLTESERRAIHRKATA